VGDGPARQEYETLVAKLGLKDRVIFHGRKPKSEVAEFMRQADLFVLPSIWENLPCVLIEAMASGLPVIATLAGGIPEIFCEELGALVPPGDIDLLSSVLSRMMGSLDQFDRRRIAQRTLPYHPGSVGKLIHSIYQNCVER
jgi:glycosyltransferase involved in cell wall biosynthesis